MGMALTLALAVASVVLAPSSYASGTSAAVATSRSGQVIAWGDNVFGQTSVPTDLGQTPVVAVSGGLEHSLALTAAGRVVAWGRGPNGGDPTPPASLDSEVVTAISAGAYHSLALTADGTITAWGTDDEGQTTVPASLQGRTVAAIAAGGNHSLALTDDGVVTAWGWNSSGQTDVPASLSRKTVVSIAAGVDTSMALTSDGRVTVWGSGAGTVPASLSGKTVTAIAAGQSHWVVATSDGEVTSWGENSDGQTDVPTGLAGHSVVSVGAGYYYSMALTADGRVVAWGRDDRSAVPSTTGRIVTAIAGGSHHLLAITAALSADRAPVISGVAQVGGALTAIAGTYNTAPDALAYQWRVRGAVVGTNGPVYRPTTADRHASVTVTVTATKAGYAETTTTSAATETVRAGGRITGWGSNFAGESTVPATLSRTSVTAIAAGFNHTLAVATDGTLTAWGAGTQGTVPPALAGQQVTAVAAGTNHNLALTAEGRVVAWGNSGNGRTSVPTTLTDRNVVSVAAGNAHSLALADDGQVTAWGGDATHNQSAVPSSLSGQRVVATAAGSDHSLALTSEGQVVAWGSNTRGQSDVPAALSGRTVTAIAAGATHSLALTADGTITAWGGDTTLNQAVVPAALTGQRVVAIATGPGADHSLALISDRRVIGWGSNANGARTVPTSLNRQANSAITAGGTHSVALTSAVVADQAPSISGTPAVGSPLTAQLGSYNVVADSYGLEWKADDVAIPGAVYFDYTPTSAQRGKTITVTVTVARSGHTDAVDTSAGVGPLDAGSFTSGPDATITGTPVVGGTLTAGTGTTSPTADSLTYTWAADGNPITGATGRTLTLTPAMVGTAITVTLTAVRDGYVDAVDTSEAVGPVAAATFTAGPDAVISGTPVVGGTLTATPGPDQLGSTTPAAESLTYTWAADGDPITGATRHTLELSPALAGQRITVTVTAHRDGHTDASDTSGATEPIAPAVFTAGPTATITGTARAGQTLTAGTGAPAPDPAAYRFSWAADDTPIAGATSPTLALSPALRGRTITVTVTASRPGYRDATSTSPPTAPVATDEAPALHLRLSVPRAQQNAAPTPDGEPTVRRGRAITLHWDATGAETLVAVGGLADLLRARYGDRPIPAQGSIRVRLGQAGTHTYRLRASNETGTTTATAGIVAVREPTRLTVDVPTALRADQIRPGRTIRIRVTGLGYRERYYVSVGGQQVRTGRATTTGSLTRRITLPRTLDTTAAATRVRVTGRSIERTGAATIRLR